MTAGPAPVRDPQMPLDFSGSSWASFDACALRWFLEHEVKGAGARGAVTAFGSVVHVLADAIARGEVASDNEALTPLAQRVWDRLGYRAQWHANEELGSALAALGRFAKWHDTRPDRELLATEAPFDTTVNLDADSVRIRGAADRLEIDPDGQLHIVDLKTQRTAVPAKELGEHRQLALYQLAASEGAFLEASAEIDASKVGGAELVQLRMEDPKSGLPKVQSQSAAHFEQVKRDLASALSAIREEGFDPSPDATKCRSCQFQRVCPTASLGREIHQVSGRS